MRYAHNIAFDNDACWLWQKIGWLTTPPLEDSTFHKANALITQEQKLLKCIGLKDLVLTISENIHDSYKIEGETLDEQQLRSSLIRELSLDIPEWRIQQNSEKADRAVTATLTALNDISNMSVQWLCDIHKIFQCSDSPKQWGILRHGPMGVVNAKNEVIYMAPSAINVKGLLQSFCRWWNDEMQMLPAPIGSALAHAFFVVIHPFEDGNGRMARLLADKAMAIGMNEAYRPYSMSSVILEGRQTYYTALDRLGFDHGLNDFVDIMLRMQNQTINFAQTRINAIQQTQNIIDSFKQNDDTLSFGEEKILQTMAFYPSVAMTLFETIEKIQAINPNNTKDLNPMTIAKAWDTLIEKSILTPQQWSQSQFLINLNYADQNVNIER